VNTNHFVNTQLCLNTRRQRTSEYTHVAELESFFTQSWKETIRCIHSDTDEVMLSEIMPHKLFISRLQANLGQRVPLKSRSFGNT